MLFRSGKVYETRASLLRRHSEPVEQPPLWKMKRWQQVSFLLESGHDNCNTRGPSHSRLVQCSPHFRARRPAQLPSTTMPPMLSHELESLATAYTRQPSASIYASTCMCTLNSQCAYSNALTIFNLFIHFICNTLYLYSQINIYNIKNFQVDKVVT